MDDLLDFINSQNHSDDQLDQVLQTYQTYTEGQSPTRHMLWLSHGCVFALGYHVELHP